MFGDIGNIYWWIQKIYNIASNVYATGTAFDAECTFRCETKVLFFFSFFKLKKKKELK